MLKLDEYDKKLLYQLDRQSNLQVNLLAKKLRRSKQFVLYRMQRLEEEGVITNYTAIVDMSKLGYFSFRVYFAMRQMTREDGNGFVAFIRENFPQVWTITDMHGKWDYALFLGVKNVGEFHKIWDNIMLKYKRYIKQYNVAVYAPVYNFNQAFFFPTKEERSVRIYGEGSPVEYDELDWKIIQEYAPNVRKSSLEIGKKLGVTGDTVRARIKKMEQKKIISGYKIHLNLEKIGYVSYRVDFELLSTKENGRLFEYCKQHPNIYQVNKSIGGANFEIEVIVKSLNHLLEVIDEVKTEFREVIEDDDYFGFSTFHVLNFIPD